MKINWTVRFNNLPFWASFIPAVLLLVQTVAALFGITLDLGEVGNKLLAVVEAVFVVLTLLGVVNDPTTKGFISDSERALKYTKPN